MNTIISRVVDALRAHGNEAEADELLQFVTDLKTNVENLMALRAKQWRVVQEYISLVRSRCPHHEWTLGEEKTFEIVCYGCGYTLCDERAYRFGERVQQGNYHIYSCANGQRFRLDPMTRRHLGDRLKAKEIKNDDEQKTLPAPRDGTEPVET